LYVTALSSSDSAISLSSFLHLIIRKLTKKKNLTLLLLFLSLGFRHELYQILGFILSLSWSTDSRFTSFFRKFHRGLSNPKFYLLPLFLILNFRFDFASVERVSEVEIDDVSEIEVKCDFRSSFVYLHQKIIIVSVFNGWRKIKHK